MKNIGNYIGKMYFNLGLAAMMALAPGCGMKYYSGGYESKGVVSRTIEYNAMMSGADKADLERQLNAINPESFDEEEKKLAKEYNESKDKKAFLGGDADVANAYGFDCKRLTSRQLILMRRAIIQSIESSGVKHIYSK